MAQATEFCGGDLDIAVVTDSQLMREVELFASELPVTHEAIDTVCEVAQDWRVLIGLREIDRFDPDTLRHVIRVGAIATELLVDHRRGKRPADEIEAKSLRMLAMGALLHDLGKTGVKRSIINPSASGQQAVIDMRDGANDRRNAAIKLHPEYGFVKAKNIFRETLDEEERRIVPQLILTNHCHNKQQGRSGPYPTHEQMAMLQEEGLLKLDDLDDSLLQWLANNLAIADVYEAITARRSYAANSKFEDPKVVLKTLLESHPDMREQAVKLMVMHWGQYKRGWMSEVVQHG